MKALQDYRFKVGIEKLDDKRRAALEYKALTTTVKGGEASARPASPVLGQMFFDTTLGKPCWWSGSAWKDATGTTV